MVALTTVVFTIYSLTSLLYWCISKDQRIRFDAPSSRVSSLLPKLLIAAFSVLIIRRMFGYQETYRDHVLFLISIMGLTIHDITVFLYMEYFTPASIE